MAGARKTAVAPEKDPEGGLTAAGRKAFAARDGSHLKPGVTKPDAEMSPEDMKRKGSWAVRFYGRAELPPLLDAKGRPTRFALSAHAWGEPVPTTEAEARAIAAKGRELLERHAATAGTPAKKASARQVAVARKAPAKDVPAKKAAVRQAAVPAAPAKKAAVRAAPIAQAPAKKAPVGKSPAKKVVASQAPANEAPVRKVPSKAPRPKA